MTISTISHRHGFSVIGRVALEKMIPTPILKPDGKPGSDQLDIDPIVDYAMRLLPAKAKRDEVETDIDQRCCYDLRDILRYGMMAGIVKCAGENPSIGDSSFFNGHDKYYTNFVKLARDRTLDFFDLLHGNDDHYRFFAPKGGNVGRQLWLLTGYRDEFESYLDNMITRFTRRYS
jgi:hypothetical protein